MSDMSDMNGGNLRQVPENKKATAIAALLLLEELKRIEPEDKKD